MTRRPTYMHVTDNMVPILHLLADTNVPLWTKEILAGVGMEYGKGYPCLRRLYRFGWVSRVVEEGPHPGRPPRHFYSLTRIGRVQAEIVLNGGPL